MSSATFLRNKLNEAIQSNPHFSLRAFAAKLKLAPGTLSKVLSRKSKLSVSRALELAQILKLNEVEKEKFLLLVQIESARSEGIKLELHEKLNQLLPTHEVNLSLEQFKLISEWYGLAIFEMISVFAGKWSSKQIAEYLLVSKFEVEAMIERLVSLEMIEISPAGGYQRVKGRVLVSSAMPAEAIQNYSRGVLRKAEESIGVQSPNEMVTGTEVFAFDSNQLEEARKITHNYLDQLQKLSQKGKKRDELYQVYCNLFRLKSSKNHAAKSTTRRSVKK